MDTVYIDTVTYLSKENVLKPFSVLDQILIWYVINVFASALMLFVVYWLL